MYMIKSLVSHTATHNSCYVCHKCFHRQSVSFLKKNGYMKLLNWQKYLSTTPEQTNLWNEPKGTRTGIYLYNALTKRKDELILPNGNHLSWYICGPTVYDSSHIGHASNYVRFDIIRRILTNFFDINVTYLMGITDVDDKIINRANELGQEFTAITSYYEKEFFQEMSALNNLQPTMTSRVTDYVPDIINFINAIVDKGHAYKSTDGSVYFDVTKYGNYFKFVPQTNEQNTVAGVKRHVCDFALWKAVKPGEPYWASPWGDGRPGWHIECSAMASRVFGSKLDIHSGGIDLKFPHHENEIAQSCSFHSIDQWANYWMHTGYLHLQFDAEKMSKSLKNTIPTSELLKKYTANQFRMFCMLSHYRSNIEFTEEKMQQAVALDNRIGFFLRQCESYVKGQLLGGDIQEAEIMQMLAEHEANVTAYLKDDFNTAGVMNSVLDLISTMNSSISKESSGCRSPGVVAAVQVYVKSLCKKLGFQKKGWKMSEDLDNLRLKEVLDHTIDFRYKVRDFALNTKLPNLESLSPKEQKKVSRKLFAPLLECCDELRTKLSHSNISVQDLETVSSWEFTNDIHVVEDTEWEESDNDTPARKARSKQQATNQMAGKDQ